LFSYNPLVAAAQRNAIGALEYLLNNGAEIDAIGHIGLTVSEFLHFFVYF
jgi:hypothetical protein